MLKMLRIILLLLSTLLYGCVYYKANINEGSFNVYAPKPFLGPGVYLFSDQLYIRGSLAYTVEDKEALVMNDVKNEGYEYSRDEVSYEILPQEDANIRYIMQSYPLSGAIDVFYKKRFGFGGGHIALDPYPSITFFVGMNALYGEGGWGIRIGYSKDDASISGRYGYGGEMSIGTFCWEDSTFRDSFEVSGSYNNANLGIYLFSSVFIAKSLSLNFSTSLYQPWLRRSIYVENAAIPHDYDITMDFPFFFSQYVGATLFLFERVQLSAGETVYYTPSSDKLHLQTNFSASYLFAI